MTLTEYLNQENRQRLAGGSVLLEPNEVSVWENKAAKCRVVNLKIRDRWYQYRTSTMNSRNLFTQDDQTGKCKALSVFCLNF